MSAQRSNFGTQSPLSGSSAPRETAFGAACASGALTRSSKTPTDDTFASTPSLATLKLLLTLACTYNWFVLAGDVSTAFLHALLNDDIFVIPPGEFYPNGGVLWKLRRAMYGLKPEAKSAGLAASLRECDGRSRL